MAILFYWAALSILNVIVIAVVLHWAICKAVKRAIVDAKKELRDNPIEF